MNNMLTLEEIKRYLEIDQEEIEKHLKQGKLHAYKIGGTYLRFRKEEVLTLREKISVKPKIGANATVLSKISDFWHFNNFYIVSL